MNLGIPHISLRVGFDLLVRGLVRDAWLQSVELGENNLELFGARFRIYVERGVADGSVILKIRALPESVGSVQGFRLRLEVGLPEAFRDFFAPGVFYRDNRHTYGAPGFMVADRWVFREDRLSLRAVAALDPAGEGIILARLDRPKFEPPKISRRKMCGEFLLPSSEFDLGSLGFGRRRPKLEAFLPAREGDLRYYEKCRNTPPLGWFYPLEGDRPVEVSYLIESFRGDVYGLLERMIEIAWERQARAEVSEPDTGAIERALVASLKARFFESKKVAGLYSWVKTFTGKPALGVCEPGFTGMVFLSCARMMEIAERLGDNSGRDVAVKVLNSWCNMKTVERGLVPDFWMQWVGSERVRVRLDVPAALEPPFIFARRISVRRLSEAAWGLIEAARIGRSDLWFGRAKTICDRLALIQMDDGSFPRQIDGSGRVSDPEGGATPSALYTLVLADGLLRGRYINAIKKAGGFVADRMVGGFEFYGATLDSDCEDKEASLIAAVALWKAAKLLGSSELKQAAFQSAMTALSWFFLWEPALPKDSLFAAAGLKVSGLGAVSSENNHVDVFLFDYPVVLRKMALEVGKLKFAEIARFILYRALEYVPRSELGPFAFGDEDVFFQLGLVPELVYHTDWTYLHLPFLVKHRHLAQGFTNPRSAGWCSASLLQALSSWNGSWEEGHETQD